MRKLKNTSEMNGRFIGFEKSGNHFYLSFFHETVLKIPDTVIDEETLEKMMGKDISLLHLDGEMYVKHNR